MTKRFSYKDIIQSHITATKLRCSNYDTVLAIQDTSYFNYSQHPKTKDLGLISRIKEPNRNDVLTVGLVMHTTFAVGTDGVPLGLLDQKIYARNQNETTSQEKESCRWIESISNTKENLKGIPGRVVTLCDREGDMYELFLKAHQLSASFVVRAQFNRTVNKFKPYAENPGEKLWQFLSIQPVAGSFTVDVPIDNDKKKRSATCHLRFSCITMNRPLNFIDKSNQAPRTLDLYAIYISEVNCPNECEPIDWMLITNMNIENYQDALEKVIWYCLRWRIESWHKILKSGLKVENCRLSTADRLMRYLAVMSIVAWRIFWVTLNARTTPDAPATTFLTNIECNILAAKFPKVIQKKQIPTFSQAVNCIARLGGFLGRKNDGEPGITHMWRGLKKFAAMIEGVEMFDNCG